MTIAPMFDVSQNPDVAAQFVQNFFDDLAWHVTTTNTRRPRIAHSLLDGLGDDAIRQTAENLQIAFANRSKTEPLKEDEWQ